MSRRLVSSLGAGAFAAVLAVVLSAVGVGRSSNVSPDPDEGERARDIARYATVPAALSGFSGAKVSASANQASTAGPITFDHAKFDLGGYWSPMEPTRVVIPEDGFYDVSAQVTVLGSDYEGSPASPAWVMTVMRNGDLHDFVCSDSQTDEDPSVAQLASCDTTDWFLAGDYVELYVTPGRTVESNWPGRGSVSPILLVTALAG